jgi:hypothetical protein
MHCNSHPQKAWREALIVSSRSGCLLVAVFWGAVTLVVPLSQRTALLSWRPHENHDVWLRVFGSELWGCY